MTVAVTGASGHVGANLIRGLLEQNKQVRAICHVSREALEGLDIEVADGDVCDPDSLYSAFKGVDVVYHLAARISLRTDDWPVLEAINVNGTRYVVEACLRAGVRRLVHFSSIHAIEQEPFHLPVDESRPPIEYQGCAPYDRSKAAGEAEVRKGIERGLDAVILSPTAIVGPHDYQPSYFGKVLLALAHGRMPALVTSGFDWVDVRDVIAGALAAEKAASTGSKYLLSGHWVSIRNVAEMIFKITGCAAPRFVCPLWLARIGMPIFNAFNRKGGYGELYTPVSLKALCSNRNISHEKAARDLEYQPRPFSDTITDTMQWFQESGQLTRPLVVK